MLFNSSIYLIGSGWIPEQFRKHKQNSFIISHESQSQTKDAALDIFYLSVISGYVEICCNTDFSVACSVVIESETT